MTTPIPAVDTERSIEHGVLIDITLTTINATTAASGTGSTATLTFETQDTVPFSIGDTIVVSGVIPTTYNGTFIVTGATNSSVSYSTTATGSQTQAGNISTIFYVSNCWKNIVYNTKTYVALAGFLSVSEIQSNISNANDEVQIGLSAIPPTLSQQYWAHRLKVVWLISIVLSLTIIHRQLSQVKYIVDLPELSATLPYKKM